MEECHSTIEKSVSLPPKELELQRNTRNYALKQRLTVISL